MGSSRVNSSSKLLMSRRFLCVCVCGGGGGGGGNTPPITIPMHQLPIYWTLQKQFGLSVQLLSHGYVVT